MNPKKRRHSQFRSFVTYPELLKEFGVTGNQYMVFESIRYLSTHNPDFKWCITPNREIADFVCMSSRGVDKVIKKGLDKQILEKNPEGYGIRTTYRWNSAVLFVKKTYKNTVRKSGTSFHHSERSSLNKVSDEVNHNLPEDILLKRTEWLKTHSLSPRIVTEAQEEAARDERRLRR